MKFQNRLGVRVIALFEGGKAILMLAGLLFFIFVFHFNAHELVETLVTHLHVNPQNHYVSLLLNLSGSFTGGKLIAACACALLYSVIKFSESIGLWHHRQWGRTLGIVSIGILIPYEGYALTLQYTHLKLMVLLINIGIVVYLLLFFNRSTMRSNDQSQL